MPFRRRGPTLALLLFGGSAHAQSGPAGANVNDIAVYARLLAMTDTRQLDTSLVALALSSSWSPLRAAAALAVGQIGPDHGLAGAGRLRALLTDRDPVVAANAAYSLGLLRDTGSVTVLGASVDRFGPVAREAAWALGEIGAPARLEIIQRLQGRRSTDVSVQLLLAAAKLRPLPLAEVRPYLRGLHPQPVWAAAYAIARTRAAAGVRDLIDLADSAVALTAAPVAESGAPYEDVRIT